MSLHRRSLVGMVVTLGLLAGCATSADEPARSSSSGADEVRAATPPTEEVGTPGGSATPLSQTVETGQLRVDIADGLRTITPKKLRVVGPLVAVDRQIVGHILDVKSGGSVLGLINPDTAELVLTDTVYAPGVTDEQRRPIQVNGDLWILAPPVKRDARTVTQLLVLDGTTLATKDTYDLPPDEWGISVASIGDDVVLHSRSNTGGAIDRQKPTTYLRAVSDDGKFAEPVAYAYDDLKPLSRIYGSESALLGVTKAAPGRQTKVLSFDPTTLEIVASKEVDAQRGLLVANGRAVALGFDGSSSLLSVPDLKVRKLASRVTTLSEDGKAWSVGTRLTTSGTTVFTTKVDLETGQRGEPQERQTAAASDLDGTVAVKDNIWLNFVSLIVEEVGP